ncbi:MAG: glucose-1-phosphate thymidylyltransferase RfbA [Candidatus Omnitrophota bacterium]
MKGIILAGGRATRLYPVTKGVCKQLLPVYDKPMVYYPLSVLMLAGIREVMVISTPKDLGRFEDLLEDGSRLGMKFSYAQQDQPRGIAESFLIAEDFIRGDSVCLVLGDNVFYGHNLTELLSQAVALETGACVFGYYVKDPNRYGVLDFDKNCRVTSIEEKPNKPKSNWAVTGLYFYDKEVVGLAHQLKPSKRGELEITCLNNEYLKRKELIVKLLGRGYAWLDTGTSDSLIDASMFIKTIEERQGLKVGCVEEIAYRMGYIDGKQLQRLSDEVNGDYGDYLRRVLNEEDFFYAEKC